MKPSDVYRKAAKLIEDEARHTGAGRPIVRHSCCAIAEAEGIFPLWNYGNKESKLANAYRDIFDGEFEPFWTEEGRDERIVALCMMAAMIESPK